MGPMAGVKVVELGVWVAGPSCAVILCDWGADVVKIEPPEGDPFRGVMRGLIPGWDGDAPMFELDNRGKQSVALNLRDPRGREIAFELIDRADVFVTNQRPGALARLGLDYDNLHRRNPRLIYAHVTGYGPDTSEGNRAAYDVGAFWSRAGVGAMLAVDGALPFQRGGMGDHNAGAQAAGAVAAALYHRERTGTGQRVTVSLARTGVYTLGWDLNQALRTGVLPQPVSRQTFRNPLMAPYTTADGRIVWLLMLQSDRHWPDFCRAVGHEEWMADPRFGSLVDRANNSIELVALIDAVIATRTLAEWSAVFDLEDVWYAPVQTLEQVLADPLMEEAGAWVDVPTGDGRTTRMVASPADFSGSPWQPRAPVPELGQHTEQVLLDLGHDWDEIVLLKEAGVIP
jgi:crotonobetainyl-CoA:carnitine CoA-transferase CaiB-like acyl-CoA transferase